MRRFVFAALIATSLSCVAQTGVTNPQESTPSATDQVRTPRLQGVTPTLPGAAPVEDQTLQQQPYNSRGLNFDPNQSGRNLPTRQTTALYAAEPAKPSDYQFYVRSLTGTMYPLYGYDAFRNVPSTFAPSEMTGAATADYVLGPGDEVRLQLWGQINQSSTYTVDRNGSIYIPQVGSVQVAGLSYNKLQEYLRSQLGRVFRNFDLAVSLGQLRSLQVFVVGKVLRPGSFTVSSLSTLLNALFASGGPTPDGSLRRVQLQRSGKLVKEFDLYDLLLHGDKSQDVRLLPGDVILVPPVGQQVAVAGAVATPAIYELRDEKTLSEVLSLAGGLLNTASTDAPVRIEHVHDGQALAVTDATVSAAMTIPVKNGDVITFQAVQHRFENAVTLRGNVATVGRYEWHRGMKVSDLIPAKEALLTQDFWARRNLLGTTAVPDYKETAPQQINEGRIGASDATPQHPELDQSLRNQNGNNTQQKQGEGAALQLQNPQQNNQRRSNSSEPVASGPSSSVGFKPKNAVLISAADIDWRYAVIERLDKNRLNSSLIPFNLGKIVLDHDSSADVELEPNDIVTVFSTADIQVPQLQRTRFIRLEGEIAAAGVYSVQPGETLADVVRRAGGMTRDAYLYGSQFTRESTRLRQKKRALEYADDLESRVQKASLSTVSRSGNPLDTSIAAASQASARSIIDRLRAVEPTGRIVLDLKPESNGIEALPAMALEDGDRFVVPRRPSEVIVEGATYNSNSFLYNPSHRAKDYLRMAGGPTREADPKREFIVRADGSIVSRQYKGGFDKKSFEHASIFAGDAIVVPQRIDQESKIRVFSDVATIIGQLGLGFAAINVLK